MIEQNKHVFNDWEEVIEEGRARVIIPRRELFLRENGVYEPAWSPVFYNPVMRVSRDFTTLVTKTAFGEKEYFFIDALAGTGIRGIRLALETNGYGVVNDVDPIAYYYMTRNILFNNVDDKVKPVMQEANTLMNNYTFSGILVDYIDIDPYGSPIPFIDSAVKPLSKNGLLGVTATDTAPLVCSHSRKTLRRYNIICSKVDFEKELGIRILIYNIVFRASSQDVALIPLLSYAHKHYFRVFFRTIRSANESYRVLKECRGYIWYCLSTLERGFTKDPNDVPQCLDGNKPIVMGPLWICKLGEQEFIEKLYKEAKKLDYIDQETLKITEHLVVECAYENPYFRYDKLFGRLKKNMPPIKEFIEFLRKHGISACRTHFDPRGIRIDKPISEAIKLIQTL
ncbi:MAG: tRNA (guanine(26)-N(2))-dimethyltransferase [Thermoprotei archaeon]